MNRISIVIYSRLEGSGQSTVYRALMFAQELSRSGDDVCVTFDGGGTVTAIELAEEAHGMGMLLRSLRPHVRGVCRYCAKSYGVLEASISAGFVLLDEDSGHASLRALLMEGYQIVTF